VAEPPRGPGRRRRRRSPPPGTAPGLLIADPEAPKPIYRVMSYGPDALEESSPASVAELEPLIRKRPMTWINMDGLGDVDAIARIGQWFELHPLALEDVVNLGQRPKVEPYPGQLFVVIRMLVEEGHLGNEQIAMFVGQGFVITFQERPGDCWDPVRERLRAGRPRLRSRGSGYLAYALLDAAVDLYFPVLERFGERLESLEEDALDRPDRATMAALRGVKRDVLVLRRTIWPLRETLQTLLREPTPLLTDEDRVYLRDCYDHAVSVMDLVENYREIGGGLTDLYLSSLSNRMNEVMKVLTMFATTFIPLGFIAGLYGMNFDPAASRWNMPELGWRYGYPFALAVMAGVALALLGYFVRRGWIGPGPRRSRAADGARVGTGAHGS
jgi:magnesium transporter